MPKTKKVKPEVIDTPKGTAPIPVIVKLDKVSHLTESFGSGDANVLKDKINEIIKCLNS